MFCPVASSLGHLRSECRRLLFTKGMQWVCGGIEEIGVGFQQRSVSGSKVRKEVLSWWITEGRRSVALSGD